MKALGTLVDDTELILGDSGNVIFSASVDVQPAVLNAAREASTIVPQGL